MPRTCTVCNRTKQEEIDQALLGGERNVSLVNIVKLAHALRLKPTNLLEPVP